MKKYIFLMIVGFLLLWPFCLESRQIYVKMSFGLFPGGQIEDIGHSTTGYYSYKDDRGEKTGPGMDVILEFIYQFFPNFSISFGAGYISRRLNGHSGRFTSPEGGYLEGDFFYAPELSSEMHPIYLTGIYSFPLMTNVQVNFLGGIGYYFGNIECSKVNWGGPDLSDPNNNWNYFTWKFKSNASTFGFHIGSGIDIDLSNNMYISVEGVYRIVNFKQFNPSVIVEFLELENMIKRVEELASNSTFLYAYRIMGDEGQGDIDYRVMNYSYSGFSFRAGVKFRF